MLIERRSPISGQWNERDIDVTMDQLAKWQNGELIQNAMPHLNADDREYIKTGITPEEWVMMFGNPNCGSGIFNDVTGDCEKCGL